MKYHKSFEKFIKESKYLKEMEDFVSRSSMLCPRAEKVFRFLECDLSKAKCIILGMDPYPSTYEKDGVIEPVATGRAFEVDNVTNWTDPHKQVSLTQIFKSLAYLKFGKIYSIEELRKLVNSENFRYMNIHKWFDAMEREGVIFLNATLTTLENKSGVHTKVWENFMNELFSYIVSENENILWLIWGDTAKKRVQGIVDERKIIYTCHPAARQNNTFVKDCTFKKIKTINWI